MTNLILLDDALRAAGISIEGVRQRGLAIEVDYSASATDQQRAQGDALVAAWDDVAETRKAQRAAAKAALVTDDPTQIASRNALRVIYASIVETRRAVNKLIAGQPVQPLAIRTWAEALAAVRQQIDAETDPTT